jgi:glutaredoxin/Ca2+-binding EF-hand superfamily protein
MEGVDEAELNCTDFLTAFSYGIQSVACGVPEITLLEGTLEIGRISFTISMPDSRLDDLADEDLLYAEISRFLTLTNATCNGTAAGFTAVTSVTIVGVDGGGGGGSSGGTNLGLIAALSGTAAFAAFAALFCCRRKSSLLVGKKGGAKMLMTLDEADLEVEREAEDVFDWLDNNGDGVVSIEEIASALDIPFDEAEAIIAETHFAVYGEGDVADVGVAKNKLSFQQFKDVMRDPARDDPLVISELMAHRYSDMFEAIDEDGLGSITPEQLAAAVGMDEDDLAEFYEGLGDFPDIQLPDFVAMLRQSELSRAALPILDALETQGQGRKLMKAVAKRSQVKRPRHTPSVFLKDGRGLEEFLKDRQTAQLSRGASRTKLSARPKFDDDALRKVSTINMVYNEQITDVSNENLDKVWGEVVPDANGQVSVEELRVALLEAHANDDILITDEDLMEAVVQLTDVADADGMLSHAQFLSTMGPFVSDTPTPPAIPTAPLGPVVPGERPKSVPKLSLKTAMASPPKLGSMRIQPGSFRITGDPNLNLDDDDTARTAGATARDGAAGAGAGAGLQSQAATTDHHVAVEKKGFKFNISRLGSGGSDASGPSSSGAGGAASPKAAEMTTDHNITTETKSFPVGHKLAAAATAVLGRMGSIRSQASSMFSESDTDGEAEEVDTAPMLAGAAVVKDHSYQVVLYTSTTHSTHFTEANERRLLAMLDAKGVTEYEVVFLDLDENADRKQEMHRSNPSNRLPQLHINGVFLGYYSDLQDLEDRGELDEVLEDEGVPFVKKPPPPTPRGVARNTATDGPMTVHCTPKFATVKWKADEIVIEADDVFSWLLLMDDEPVYVGNQSSYVIPMTDTATHHFELCAVDDDGNFLENDEGEQILSEIFLSAPMADQPIERTGRLLSVPLSSRPDLVSARGGLVTPRSGRPTSVRLGGRGGGTSGGIPLGIIKEGGLALSVEEATPKGKPDPSNAPPPSKPEPKFIAPTAPARKTSARSGSGLRKSDLERLLEDEEVSAPNLFAERKKAPRSVLGGGSGSMEQAAATAPHELIRTQTAETDDSFAGADGHSVVNPRKRLGIRRGSKAE